MDNILGTTIERRYLLRETIGEGGFAEVFEASDIKLGRRIAIKILKPHPEPAQRIHAQKRFFREAKLSAQLNHPHIVTIFDYGQTEDERPYIAMELLDGDPLSKELWHHGPIEPHRAHKLFLQIAHAIGAAHKQGVIHRDLKPSNILLVHKDTHLESIKIVDFGIAFFFEEALTRLTSTGQFLGTPEYLAPEYIGEREITPALDVYQLALIFIEMLTGRPLVSFDEPIQCMFAHYNGHVKVPEYLKNSPLGNVLERALTSQHTQRFHNASSLFEALQHVDPDTIPKIPEQATPEQLGVTKDWDSVEVDKFSQAFEHKLAHMPPVDPLGTASMRPEQPRPSGRQINTLVEQTPSNHLRLVGGGILAAIILLGITAVYIQQNKEEPAHPATAPSYTSPTISQGTTTPSSTPPPRASFVLIQTTPDTAKIMEDSTLIGTGSVSLALQDSSTIRHLTIAQDGYVTHTQEISQYSPETIKVTLKPKQPAPTPDTTPPTVAATQIKKPTPSTPTQAKKTTTKKTQPKQTDTTKTQDTPAPKPTEKKDTPPKFNFKQFD